MNEELKARVREHIEDMISGAEFHEYSELEWDRHIDRILQACQEESHINALVWYTRLTNDLINDDDLKHTEHVGRILEYARIAAGLTEEDVKIELPDEYVPHNPDLVAEHISPVVKVDKTLGFYWKKGERRQPESRSEQ